MAVGEQAGKQTGPDKAMMAVGKQAGADEMAAAGE